MWLFAVFFYKYFRRSCSNENSFLGPRLQEFKCITRLVTMTQGFSVQIVTVNSILISFFSNFSWSDSLFPSQNWNNVNRHLLSTCNLIFDFPFYSLKSSRFLTLQITPCVSVELLPCFGWNNTHTAIVILNMYS